MNNHILNNFNKRIIRFICGALLMCICSSISYATDVTEVDLTGLATGTDVNHQHVYVDSFDETYHFKRCFICGDEINKATHTMTRTDYAYGYASCYSANTYTVYCSDNCGYSYVTYDQPHQGFTGWTNDSSNLRHIISCTACGATTRGERCYKSDGTLISCNGNYGTCVVCGFTYTASNTKHFGSYRQADKNGVCSVCGKRFANVTYSTRYENNRQRYVIVINLQALNGAQISSSFSMWSNAGSNGYTATFNYSGNETQGTETITIDLNPNYQKKIKYVVNGGLRINDMICSFQYAEDEPYNPNNTADLRYFTCWYDNVAPTISNVTQTDISSSNGWATSKRFTVTGTDNASDGIYIKMTDTNGNELLPYSYVTTSNGSYTYSFTPNVEANESTPFIIWAKDNIGNESQKTIYVEKIDNQAPSLTKDNGDVVESLNYLSPWRRNEKVTFKIKDNGIGQVQIAFNNPSDYQVATYNSSTGYYERTYNFYGDVPTQVTGALYTKDGLGNEKMYKINFDKLNSQSGAGEFAFEAQTESIATSVFMGYYTTQSGEGNQIIQSTGYITNENDNRRFVEDSTIYARWDGGTITLPSRSKPGYTFLGWSETEGATEATYTPGETIALSQNKELYAVWEERSMGQYLDGESFNTALSGLAGSASNITSISWEEGQFSENDVPADAIDVSANDAPIWAWYEGNGTIKLWSNSNEAILSDDCSKMFKDMSLTSMDVVSDLHIAYTNNVTDMSEMFSECHEIESIDFSDFDTSNVTNMAQLFENNRKLTSLDISDFDTSNVTNMYYMFRGNDINPSIDVSNFDTSNVTNMEGMFRYCKGLTELDLSNFNTSQVTNMKDMFRFCDLEKIYVSAEDFDVSSVTSSSNMFTECFNLTGGNGTGYETTNSNNVTYAHVDGYDDLPGYFWSHDQFTVTFNANAGGDTVTNMPSSVTEVYGTKIDLTTNTTRSNNNYRLAGWSTSSGDNGTYYYGPQGYAVVRDVTLYAKWVARNDAVAQYIDGTSFNLKIRKLAGNNTTDVTTTTNKINHIEWQTTAPDITFTDNNLVSVNPYLPIYAWYESGTKTIKLWSDCPYRIFNDDASNMLRCMTTLQSLDPLGNLGVVDTSNVVSMANMFKKDTALTTLDISGFNTENVTSMESLFAYNSSLTSINVDNIDTSKVTTMKEMFRLCGKLTTLDISSFDSSSLTIANQMFKECSRLTRIYASTAFTGDNLTNSSEMFNSCSNLVGGNGTTYNSSNITGSYAWIDGRVDPDTGVARQGYFTQRP